MVLPFCLSAQLDLGQLEGGLFLGVSNYQGDFTLNTAPEIAESNVALGVAFRYPLSPTHAVRINALYGKLSGTDKNFEIREQRGANFQTALFEFSAVGEWEPFGRNRTDLTLNLGQRVSPYFFGGVGLAFIRPKTVYGDSQNERAVQDDKNADYGKIQPAIPVGLGLRMGINEMMSLSAELGMRKTFTDFLDGVSHSGKLGTDDWYLFGGFMFLYKIQ